MNLIEKGQTAYYYGYYGVANQPGPIEKKKVEKNLEINEESSSQFHSKGFVVKEEEEETDLSENNEGNKKEKSNPLPWETSRSENLIEWGLVPFKTATKFLCNLTTKPRWITTALTLGAIYKTSKLFYPKELKSLRKQICSLLPAISKDSIRLAAFVFTALTVVSIGIRAFARYGNERFVKFVKEQIGNLKHNRELAKQEKIDKNNMEKIGREMGPYFVEQLVNKLLPFVKQTKKEVTLQKDTF